jgi:mono/diheme cytochrome c family protein
MKYFAFAVLIVAAQACGGDDGGDGDGMRVDDILELSGNATAGEDVFAITCGDIVCHGPDGSVGAAPNLPEKIPALSRADLVDIVVNGFDQMDPLGGDLNDQQIADVVEYAIIEFQ